MPEKTLVPSEKQIPKKQIMGYETQGRTQNRRRMNINNDKIIKLGLKQINFIIWIRYFYFLNFRCLSYNYKST